MAYYRNVIVNQAKSWLGVKQGDATHKEIVDIYNGHKPLARGYKPTTKSAWCSLFVSAVSIKCGYTAIIPTEVSCHYHIELFKKLGCWVEADNYVPNKNGGDLILYDWDETSASGDNRNSPDHIGIVEKVVGDTITVIEGNCDSAVKRRTIKVNGKYIRGYGVPKYDGDEEPTQKVEKSIDELAQEVLDGKHGNGSARKQSLGDKYDEVQARVNEMLKANSIKEGSIVKVSKDAVIGGLASNRGKKASTLITSGGWKVKSLATHKSEQEALLSCNTWIAVKYLTVK